MLAQVTIRTTIRGETKDVWFVVETSHENLAALHRSLISDDSIFGTRLETRPLGNRLRQVSEEYETIIMASSIVSICELQFDLQDADGETIFAIGEAA
jgi:hypothetical protein